MDYRNTIANIASRYAEPGDELERALLEGSPEKISAATAKSIALWLETEAESAWGEDPRYRQMAAEIRAAILATKQGR